LFDTAIDFSKLVAKGEDLQSVEVEGFIVDATINPPTMVVEGQVARSHQLIWLTLIYIAIYHLIYS
jgi:hypothetical protein